MRTELSFYESVQNKCIVPMGKRASIQTLSQKQEAWDSSKINRKQLGVIRRCENVLTAATEAYRIFSDNLEPRRAADAINRQNEFSGYK